MPPAPEARTPEARKKRRLRLPEVDLSDAGLRELDEAPPEPPLPAPAAADRHQPGLRARMLARAVQAAGRASQRRGGGGSVVGGRVGLVLSRRAIRRLAGGRWVAAVSGTNGKTTTTHLLTAALATRCPVVSNHQGSNLRSGIVSALARDLHSPAAVLELDEATLARSFADLSPAVVVLLNLSRDQLDRYGEVRLLAGRWRTCLFANEATHVVANVDDPLVVWAAAGCPSVTWVAVGQRWRADASVCPACGSAIERDDARWACAACDLHRPSPDWTLDDDRLTAADGSAPPLPVQLSLPGAFNVANAALAAVAAGDSGLDVAAALAAMGATSEVAGRYRTVEVDGRSVRLLMAKNPAGWQEALDLLDEPPTAVLLGINARVADGHDPSWLWDVPFEVLAGRPVVAAGDRALDLAVRLGYAGVDHATHPGPLFDALAALPAGARVDVIGNYTAFADLLRSLPGAAA